MTTNARECPVAFEEYRALPEDGPRVELINGELVEIAPPSLRHQFASGELFIAIDDYAMRNKSGLVLFGPYDVRLSRHTAAQPDLLYVTTANRRVMGEDYATGAPDLMIEVTSRTSRRVDCVLKMALYADHGVREYWIVDPDERTVSVNVLRGDGYSETMHTGGAIEFATLPGLAIEMATLFDLPDWWFDNDEDDEGE